MEPSADGNQVRLQLLHEPLAQVYLQRLQSKCGTQMVQLNSRVVLSRSAYKLSGHEQWLDACCRRMFQQVMGMQSHDSQAQNVKLGHELLAVCLRRISLIERSSVQQALSLVPNAPSASTRIACAGLLITNGENLAHTAPCM